MEIDQSVDFDEGRRDLEPKNLYTSRDWKRQGTDFLLEPPEGTQFCQHLAFNSLGILISRIVKMIHFFKAIYLW